MEINGLVVPMRITSFLPIRMAGDKQYREMMYHYILVVLMKNF